MERMALATSTRNLLAVPFGCGRSATGPERKRTPGDAVADRSRTNDRRHGIDPAARAAAT